VVWTTRGVARSTGAREMDVAGGRPSSDVYSVTARVRLTIPPSTRRAPAYPAGGANIDGATARNSLGIVAALGVVVGLAA
jgi:hypothetical protein